MKRWIRTHWHWYVLYAVPLAPLWFLVRLLLPYDSWQWTVGWLVACLACSVSASVMERKYWPEVKQDNRQKS